MPRAANLTIIEYGMTRAKEEKKKKKKDKPQLYMMKSQE